MQLNVSLFMIKMIITDDGSHTLFNTELKEHYHSTFGAIQESMHIFIEAGLKFQISNVEKIKLLEVGFGTGLNALLSLNESLQSAVNIEYSGVEPFPVKDDLVKSLNYGEIIKSDFLAVSFEQMHDFEWNKEVALSSGFKLKKINTKIELVDLPKDYFNLVYFDAFAPDVQSELWTKDVFKKLYESMIVGGVLVTYSVKGTVKRALKSAGFIIEKLPGPIGKREFLRASKTILTK